MSYLSKTKHKVADITQRIADMEKDMLAISAANSLLLDKTETVVQNLQEGNFASVTSLPEEDNDCAYILLLEFLVIAYPAIL